MVVRGGGRQHLEKRNSLLNPHAKEFVMSAPNSKTNSHCGSPVDDFLRLLSLSSQQVITGMMDSNMHDSVVGSKASDNAKYCSALVSEMLSILQNTPDDEEEMIAASAEICFNILPVFCARHCP